MLPTSPFGEEWPEYTPETFQCKYTSFSEG